MLIYACHPVILSPCFSLLDACSASSFLPASSAYTGRLYCYNIIPCVNSACNLLQHDFLTAPACNGREGCRAWGEGVRVSPISQNRGCSPPQTPPISPKWAVATCPQEPSWFEKWAVISPRTPTFYDWELATLHLIRDVADLYIFLAID